MSTMKILIVDDEPAIITMYMEKLVMEGFTVIVATDGQSALEKAQAEKPDIILLDVIMPNVNGLDTLKQLKANPETAQIPVYLLTNIQEETGAEHGKQFGAAGYFFKAETEPRTLAALLKEIKR